MIESPNCDNNEIDEDFSSIGFKNVAAFIFSEVQLHHVMVHQLLNVPIKAFFVPIKHKIFEQALTLKKDEFDCYTCMVLAIQRMRNIFLREVNRFIVVFSHFCLTSNYSNSMQQVKR